MLLLFVSLLLLLFLVIIMFNINRPSKQETKLEHALQNFSELLSQIETTTTCSDIEKTEQLQLTYISLTTRINKLKNKSAKLRSLYNKVVIRFNETINTLTKLPTCSSMCRGGQYISTQGCLCPEGTNPITGVKGLTECIPCDEPTEWSSICANLSKGNCGVGQTLYTGIDTCNKTITKLGDECFVECPQPCTGPITPWKTECELPDTFLCGTGILRGTGKIYDCGTYTELSADNCYVPCTDSCTGPIQWSQIELSDTCVPRDNTTNCGIGDLLVTYEGIIPTCGNKQVTEYRVVDVCNKPCTA